MADGPVVDQWSGLDHKVGMGETSGGLDAAPEWIPDADKRRFNAFARIRAILETVGREYLEEDPRDPDKAAAWLEFGDAAVLVGRQAHGVLGEDPELVIYSADVSLSDSPDIPRAPQQPDPPEGTDPAVTSVLEAAYQVALTAWQANAEAIIAEWEQAANEAPLLRARQEWLRDWAAADQFMGKVFENETENIVPMGTGVYVFGWDPVRRRPTTEIYEPEAYHPVLDDAAPSQFPERVHLAWEFTTQDANGEDIDMVRRITYELVPITGEDAVTDIEVGSRPLYLEPEAEWTHTCLLSDGQWPLEAFEEIDGMASGVTWATVPGEGEELIELNRYPIGLDFIPVVAVPNTQSAVTHFGRSPLVRLTQLLDELQATDTDEALCSRWVARPPIGVSGMSAGETTLDATPGMAFRLADNGRVSTISMSENLVSVVARRLDLLKRLSVNGQVPEGLLGRVDASEVPSGLALTLSFTSFEQLVEAMRLARAPKYALCAKFVQRIAIQNGDETIGDPVAYPGTIEFGAFMPQDLPGIAQVLTQLREADLLSQETGLLMARQGGVPSQDLAAELASIRRGMADVGDLYTAALEDPRYAADFMGVDYNEDDRPEDPDTEPVAPPPGAEVDTAPPV